MILKDFWVLFFLPIAIFLVFYFTRKNRTASFRFPDESFIKGIEPSSRIKFRKKIIYLRLIVISLFFLALSRPVIILKETKIERQGIDIILSIDCSGSMKAEDFVIGGKRKNRLEVVKSVVADFIKGRDGDRIGIVSFAGRAYTACPLTLDYDWVISNLERIKIGLIEDGTAIGSAIAASLNRLKDSTAKSKIIILLSDGVNNAGKINPLTAAELAKALGIRIYTIGVGSKGWVPYPIKDIWGREIYQDVKIELDEALLTQIASVTGGRYFLATNTNALVDIYREIDRMEKTSVEERGYRRYSELFGFFLIAALLLLLGEILLVNTLLRAIP